MKKNKNIVLSVPKPCTENWADMTPDEKGRHCASCNKTVVDFSTYTDRELSEFINNNQGRICGRFTPYQLNREISVYETGNNSVWQKVMWGTALATSLAACNTTPSKVTDNANTLAPNDTNKKSPTNSSTLTDNYISGVVRDTKSGQPVPHLVVSIKRTNYHSITDTTGVFKISVPDSVVGKKIRLALIEDKLYKVMPYSYREIEYTIDKLPFNVNIKMKCTLDELPALVGQVCVSPSSMNPTHDSNYIYPFVENMPKFKGDINKYLAEHIVYPGPENIDVVGKVYISFVVEKSGEVTNVKALRGIPGAPQFDSAALKAFVNMPRWTPGTISGKPVRVQYAIPIHFTMDSDSTNVKK